MNGSQVITFINIAAISTMIAVLFVDFVYPYVNPGLVMLGITTF